MTKEKDEEQGGVKFVDRRRFTEEGDDREADKAEPVVNSSPADDAAPTEPEPAPATARAPRSETTSDEATQPLEPIDFTAFIQSLAQQTLMHMGVMAHPETGKAERDLGLARQSIDILAMLHKKTRGNLSDTEQKMFDMLLHDLRLAYVQVSRMPADAATSPIVES